MVFNSIPSETLIVEQNSTRIFLQNIETVWALEKGSVDIIYIDKITEEGTKRQFIQEFTQEALLFGFPQTDFYKIKALATSGSILKKFERKKIDLWLKANPDDQDIFLKFLNQWIATLSTVFIQWRIEKDLHIFRPDENHLFSLKEGEKCIPAHLGLKQNSVQWVELQSGKLELLSWLEAIYEPHSMIPLCSRVWMNAVTDCILKEISPTDLLQNAQWFIALNQFHTLFLQGLHASVSLKTPRETELLLQRTQLEEENLNTSFLTLASVLQTGPYIEETKKDPLVLACSLIGQKINMSFEAPPPGLPVHNIAEKIKKICDASNARFRKVAITGSWFREDSGNLVGFFEEDLKPVALLSNDNGTYTMVDPETMEHTKINAAIASKISSQAFELYSSFPNTVITLKEMIAFTFWGQKKNLILVFLLGFMMSLLSLCLPFGSKLIFGTAIAQLNVHLLWNIGGAIFAAAFSSLIYHITQGFLIFRVNSYAGNRLETGIVDRLLKLPVRFFRQFSVGDLYARISGFITMRRSFSNYNIVIILNAFFATVSLCAMFIFSSSLALISLVFIGISLGLLYFFLHRMLNVQRASFATKGTLNGFILQVISGISKLRVTGGEKRAFSRWAKQYADAKKNDLLSNYYGNAIETIFSMMPTLSLFLIFSVIIYYIQGESVHHFESTLSQGNFFGFITAFTFFSGAIFSSIPAIIFLYKVVRPIWRRGQVIFDEEPEIKTEKKLVNAIQGFVALEQISFRYDPKLAYTLKNVSIKAAPGEFIGIIGPSGSGKSTLMRLLLGFETPEIGSVTYDGYDLAHLDLCSIRRQIGVVMQQGSILAGTIYENLVCGGIYSQEQVERAIQLSAFDQDLWNFPMGLHTVLSSGGETLSGGQRQRLLIARALISDPKILLFDEATSALDNLTQAKLSKNIQQLNVTRIVIAHRLSAVQQSDRIYVLDKGEIIEEGTFEELSSKKGLFSTIFARQKI